MEELVGIMNQLQDVFNASCMHDFDLPQIAVVGSQSSGKSSVLEHLVGRSFLPRGTGVVTRCPLLLQLVNSSRNNTITKDYAIFQHKKTEVFTDYKLITQEIIDQTELLTGGDRVICSTPIFLKIHSASCTNLTLVDLPGITKVPVGNQPANIEQQTKDLIHQYIDRPNCIILVVTPANADMATCEGLKIAREVDPAGVRTLCVVTKLDLMDQGTDARAMLSGNVIPVKLGIIGVVNRSQKGILENKSMKQSLIDEAAFLSKNYKDVQSIHGTPYLTKTIQTILISHIQECLPRLKEDIEENLKLHRLQLVKFADIVNGRTWLVDVVHQFSSKFHSKINGTVDIIDTEKIIGGASIVNIFSSTYDVLEAINPLEGLSENDVRMSLNNAYGINVTCFIPNIVFEHLVKKQIKRLHSPCLTCVDAVFKEMIRIIQSCVSNPELQLEGYPKLQKIVSATSLDLLESHFQPTKEMVNHLFDIHLAYINYDHMDFLPNRTNGQHSHLNATNHPDVEYYKDICDMIKRYFSIVRRSVRDMLPKVIMCFMVNTVMKNLQPTLMSNLLSNHDDSELLQESPELINKKNMINESLVALEKADSILKSKAFLYLQSE